MIYELEQRLRQRYPEAVLKVDPPKDQENGVWWLDASSGGVWLVIQYKAPSWWGCSQNIVGDPAYTHQSDVCYQTMEGVLAYVLKHFGPGADASAS